MRNFVIVSLTNPQQEILLLRNSSTFHQLQMSNFISRLNLFVPGSLMKRTTKQQMPNNKISNSFQFVGLVILVFFCEKLWGLWVLQIVTIHVWVHEMSVTSDWWLHFICFHLPNMWAAKLNRTIKLERIRFLWY